MARPARFSHDKIVAAASRVAARRGPSGATVARIAQALRAPTGSIYHRFSSRNVLLGEVWLQATESFQNHFAGRLSEPDPEAAGLAAVLCVPMWARERPQESRILLLHRREDFFDNAWPKALTDRAKGLSRQLADGLNDFCMRLFGRNDDETIRILLFALAEAPLAAVRQHVAAGEPPPPVVDTLIEQTYNACIALGRGQT